MLRRTVMLVKSCLLHNFKKHVPIVGGSRWLGLCFFSRVRHKHGEAVKVGAIKQIVKLASAGGLSTERRRLTIKDVIHFVYFR